MISKGRLFLIGGLCLALSPLLHAQDDLLAQLEEEAEEQTRYTIATFKGTKVVNLQSNEMPAEGVLQYTFMHRFGAFNNDFFYNFLGLDNAQVMLTLDYSPYDWLNVGLGRTGFLKTYHAYAKYRLLRQSEGEQSSPVSITGFSAAYYSGQRYNDDLPRNTANRMRYVNELVIARKFSSDFSMELVPTLVHSNLVEEVSDNNSVFALGVAGRYKITNMHAISLEYVHQFNPNQYLDPATNTLKNYNNNLSIGYVIETGGHVFHLFVSNAQGIAEPYVFAENRGSWADGDLHFGFNISRVFTLKKPDKLR